MGACFMHLYKISEYCWVCQLLGENKFRKQRYSQRRSHWKALRIWTWLLQSRYPERTRLAQKTACNCGGFGYWQSWRSHLAQLSRLTSCSKPSPREFWGYTNQVRLRRLAKIIGFVTGVGRFRSCSWGFNQPLQDRSLSTSVNFLSGGGSPSSCLDLCRLF